jgi:hypothetical protein
VVWFGLWLLACSHWLGLVLVIAAVYMTNMLVRHTGKKLLEKHMARSRGTAYADYVRRTSGFVPCGRSRDEPARLSTSVTIVAGHAYTVAGVGARAGLTAAVAGGHRSRVAARLDRRAEAAPPRPVRPAFIDLRPRLSSFT